MYSQKFIDTIKGKLEEEKKVIETEINKLSTPEAPVDNPHSEDLANDAAEDIIEESLLKIHRDILERINDALGRIKDGTYGRCIECGKEIEEEDLSREPWAEYCDKCTRRKPGA